MAKKFLSREEYLKQKRQEIIDKSLENSNNRVLPTVPLILRESEKEWKENINNLIEVAKSKLNDAIQYNHGKDKVDGWQNELNRLNDKLNKGYTEELCAGDSCIYTATDNYGKKYRISGNQSFRANPAKYGFEEINLNDIKPGDIIQDFSLRDNTPHHAITFIGYDNDNKALYNYSNGRADESAIKKNVHYPFMLDYDEPSIHLNGINNNDLRHRAAAYRFIGTEDDNKVWNENYNKERSDWSKQVVEELRKVPTLILPNQVQMMKFGGMKQDKVFKLKGGVAIPLDDKKRLFYLNGAKHEQGGIDITPELEAEGGEVVKINPKSIKVVTAQKIMGGKSPAELVVNASPTGKSEKVFNKVFNYQEDFKDRYNLNDDGTKKAKWGIIEKIKNSKVGRQILNHLKFETFFDNEKYDSNIIPMDNQIANGEYGLYPIAEHSSYNKSHFYKKDDKIVYDDNWDHDRQPGYMQYRGYEPLSYDELRTMLPKRDYIGGSKRDVGIKVINKVPGLKDEILRLSELYGISPNVFTQRLVNEGWVQNQAKFYNESSVKEQKNYNWDKMNNFVDGFNTLGLDTFGNHHKKGHLNLRRDIKYDDNFTTNEDGTGRVYNSANFDNMYDALEAKAAMIEYLTKLGKKKGHTGSDLDAWVNAAYNMGEYHEDLNNMDYVRRKYRVKPYYRYGGEMKNKKKADLGTFNPNSYLWQPLASTRGNVQYPYRLEEVVQPEDKNESSSNQTQNNNVTASRVKIQERTTPTTTNNSTSETIKTTTTPIQANDKSFIPTTNNNFRRLNLDFLNEITNPNGSTYNLRTGQTYFKDWNKVRTTPYSSFNLETGETKYAGFINPYGSEIQSSVYNNGPKGREERTAKERLLNAGDWVNMGANATTAITDLIVGLTTPDLKSVKYADPIPYQAFKNKTRVNITPKLQELRNTINKYKKSINENTISSKVNLNRLRDINLLNLDKINEIYGYKDNRETELINKDIKNLQEITNKNIKEINTIDQKNLENEIAAFNINRGGIGDTISGFIHQLAEGTSSNANAIERRKSDMYNTAMTYLSNPNVKISDFKEGLKEVLEELKKVKLGTNYKIRRYKK